MEEQERFRDLYERTAAPTTDAAINWLLKVRNPDMPSLLWVHYMDPHGPYTPPEPKVRDFIHSSPRPVDAEDILAYQRHPGVTDGLEYVDLYDEEIAHLDHHLGRLLMTVERSPRFKNTLVVLTADHGETMMEHGGFFRHEYHVYEELVHVPLAFRGLRFGQRHAETPVSIVDIAPTIIDAIGKSIPDHLDGQSLLREPEPKPIFVESNFHAKYGRWRAVIDGHEKWTLLEPRNGWPPTSLQYFNLEVDPSEQNPRSWEPDSAPAAAQALLASLQEDNKGRHDRKPLATDEALLQSDLTSKERKEAEDMLRSLGYIE